MTFSKLASALPVFFALVMLGACSPENEPTITESESAGASSGQVPQPVVEQSNAEGVVQVPSVVEVEAVETVEEPSTVSQPDPAPEGEPQVENADSSEPEPPAAAVSYGLPAGPGKEQMKSVCSQCHGVATVTAMRRSEDEWRNVIVQMLDLGADATEEQAWLIFNYLTEHFGL